MPFRARNPYILTLLRNEGKRGRRPRTTDGSIDNSIEDSFGEDEGSLESADKGRGLEDEGGKEVPDLGCAILRLVYYCCSREDRTFGKLEVSGLKCRGLNRTGLERLRI
jgi:hypothetical protein